MSLRFVATLLVLSSLAVPCAAAETTASGWVRLDAFSSTRTLDDRGGDGSIEVGAKFGVDFDERHSLRFEGGLIREMRDDRDRSRIVDAYWQQRGDAVDWRIGQQKVSWGKADGLNPTDFFTPRDYTLLQPFEDDQRRSVPALRADVAFGDGRSLALVAVPRFSAERQPTSPGPAITGREPDGWRRPQFGLRWSSAGDTLDWSVSAFHGYLNSPLLGADAAGLYRHYAKLDAVGADVARNFGRFGFRAEAAWLEPRTEGGTQGINPHLFLVAGVDRGADDWNVNVQVVVRHTPGFEPPRAADPANAAAARQNAINFGQTRRTQWGFTGRLAATWWNQTLSTEVLAVHYLAPSNTLIRPLATYAIDDANKLTVGAEIYRGPPDSFFGQLEANRTVFVEFRHFF